MVAGSDGPVHTVNYLFKPIRMRYAQLNPRSHIQIGRNGGCVDLGIPEAPLDAVVDVIHVVERDEILRPDL